MSNPERKSNRIKAINVDEDMKSYLASSFIDALAQDQGDKGEQTPRSAQRAQRINPDTFYSPQSSDSEI